MKRFLTCLAMLLLVAGLTACGDAEPKKLFSCSKREEGIQIINLIDKNMKEVVIPNKIDKVPVTVISAWAFSYCADLTDIRLPKELTDIGNFAFWGCSSLKEVNIPDGVTSINSSAFYGCSSLKKITWRGNTYTDVYEFVKDFQRAGY